MWEKRHYHLLGMGLCRQVFRGTKTSSGSMSKWSRDTEVDFKVLFSASLGKRFTLFCFLLVFMDIVYLFYPVLWCWGTHFTCAFVLRNSLKEVWRVTRQVLDLKLLSTRPVLRPHCRRAKWRLMSNRKRGPLILYYDFSRNFTPFHSFFHMSGHGITLRYWL